MKIVQIDYSPGEAVIMGHSRLGGGAVGVIWTLNLKLWRIQGLGIVCIRSSFGKVEGNREIETNVIKNITKRQQQIPNTVCKQ